MTPIFAKPARPDAKIPLPGGGLFSRRGETVDGDIPYIRRLIADGDIVVADEAGTTDHDAGKPAKRKG